MLFIYSIGSMVGLVTICALILFIAYRKFHVEEDLRIKQVEDALAGLNCGVCGYPSCRLLAEAIVKEEADINTCIVGGEEVTKELAKMMGKEVKKINEKNVALIHCGIDSKSRKLTSEYYGIRSCGGASLIMLGGMACKYGCLGLGDCAKACPTGAISMKNTLPVVDTDQCIGCGACLKACPRNIITLHKLFTKEKITYVACNNQEDAKEVRKVCKIGCIACGICERLSGGIFEVRNNLPYINWEKAEEKKIDWEGIIQKCPSHCIKK